MWNDFLNLLHHFYRTGFFVLLVNFMCVAVIVITVCDCLNKLGYKCEEKTKWMIIWHAYIISMVIQFLWLMHSSFLWGGILRN